MFVSNNLSVNGKGHLTFADMDTTELAGRYGTPLYVMDEEMIRDMDSRGIDVCGENGEYHTIVLDGPLFHRPVGYICREILDFGTISAVNIVSGED